MDLSVQDWLIVIGALLIAGVLLDAYRRYRNESRNPIRMGRRPGFWKMGDGFRDEAEPSGSAELPNGGARVRDRSGDGERAGGVAPRAGERVEPSLDGVHAERLAPRDSVPPAAPRVEPPRPGSPRVEVPRTDTPRAEPKPPVGAPVTTATPASDADEVLVIHVLARAAEGFTGEALARIFQACDVRFGALSIFHRHEEEKGQGAVQFSVANVTRPGSFPDAVLAGFASPGLSFILRLPGPQRPLEAFDCMLETARAIARNLDGELQDESHSVFTSQTAEHCRERIREFVHRSARPRRPS